MKKSFFVAIAVGCSLLGSYAFASTTACQQPKVYVNKHDVKMSKNIFLIKTSNGFVRAKALRSDKHGMYVLRKDVIVEKRVGAGEKFSCPGRNCGAVFSSRGALASHMRYCRGCR
jgi:hypothetical protein